MALIKCPACGNPEVNQFASGKFHCPYCGTAFTSDGSICEKPVERPVEKPVMNETAVPQNAVQGNDGAGKSKSHKALLLGVGALVVGAIVFAVVKGISTKSNTESPQADVAVTETAALFATGTENGHEYVDLGLPSGTMWATCNVGAMKPEEFGDYYAWGETTEKNTYSWSTYLDGKMKSEYDCGTNKDALNGVTDIAGTQYDAAKANWGGTWHMPTKGQQDELRNECYWVWTENYNTTTGIKGYIVYKAKSSSDKGVKTDEYDTSSSSYKLSDAHIFLPAAGAFIDDSSVAELLNANWGGCYWSSSLTDHWGRAWYVSFNSDNVSNSNGGRSYDFYGHNIGRYVGQSVRAVCGSGNADSNDNTSAGTTGTEDGHDYVDFGLPSGTKWATCNVGAENPRNYGDYYAWGETTEKNTYSWNTYLDGRITSESDCGTDKDAFKGVTDISGTQYDAAKANWGGKWRMPTYEQWHELNHECYWVWTKNYSSSHMAGYIIYKAKKSDDKGRRDLTPSAYYSLSDAHIFLPAAGACRNGDLVRTGFCGYYWSSLRSTVNLHDASVVSFTSDSVCGYGRGTRCCGLSVRAVISGK